MATSVVLLSAGLDSTVNFQCAIDAGKVAAALTFDYGQRAARREIACSAAICARAKVRHEIIPLPWMAAITKTALVSRLAKLPKPKSADLDKMRKARKTASAVWVPNRNGVFLSIAAAFAESLRAERVIAGFNAEEAATFPDNSAEFARAFTRSLKLSTMTAVRVESETIRLRKPEIIKLGLRIGASLDLIWVCYEGGKRFCGRCESCLRFLRAARQARATEWFEKSHPLVPLRKKA